MSTGERVFTMVRNSDMGTGALRGRLPGHELCPSEPRRPISTASPANRPWARVCRVVPLPDRTNGPLADQSASSASRVFSACSTRSA